MQKYFILSKTESKNLNSKPRINRWFVFSIVAMALLMNTIDSNIVATALHTLQEDLNTSVSWAGWIITAYAFGFVLMLPLSAKLSTQFGHRRVFITSVATFTLASLLCGLSNNIYTLITMRVLQAVGGAGITPSATGIIVEKFHTARDKFLGLFGSIFSIGTMIGPVFGGIFVTYWTWQWIFFINIPIGLMVVILAWCFIPADERKIIVGGEKMDFVGLLFLAMALLLAMYSGTIISNNVAGGKYYLFTFLLISSILFFALFYRHIKRVPSPFIQARFISGAGFGTVNILNIAYSGMVIGALSLVPLYAIKRYGISEINSGTLLVTQGVASVIMSTIMSINLRRTGYRLPLYIGCSLTALGVFLLTFHPPSFILPFWWLSLSTLLIGFGFGFMSPAARNAGIHLEPHQSANIAAIRSLGLQLGNIFSVAIATTIITISSNETFAQSMVYLALSVILFMLLPTISKVPENRGSW